MKPQVLNEVYYGHEIEVVISRVTPNLKLDNQIPQCIKDEIFEMLEANTMSGTFTEKEMYGDAWVDRKEVTVSLSGSWRVLENKLIISENEGDTFDIHLSPQTTPETFKRKVKCLMSSGLSEKEAIEDTLKTPIQLEIFYDIGVGLFCVESDAVDSCPIYNPYSGKIIMKEEN